MSTRVALITGANSGVGAETARQLGLQNIEILVGSRDKSRGEEAVKKLIVEGIKARCIQLDVTDQKSIDNAVDEVTNSYGKLDILINNAGVYMKEGPLSQLDMALLRQTFETNFFGVFAVTKAFLPLIKKSLSGRIVNVSSGLASYNFHQNKANASYAINHCAYSTSKIALNMLTVQLAKELEKTNIKVNVCTPGLTATGLTNYHGHSVELGAKSSVYLALLPDDGPTGQFLNSDLTVTGANKGIGYAIVQKLSTEFDGIVYLTSRNEELGLKAVEDIQSSNPSAKGKVHYHQLDISSVESIRRLADYLKKTYGGFDVLVNNAAIAFKSADVTPFGEQAEVTGRSNFFGTMNVCNALFPLLRQHARFVTLICILLKNILFLLPSFSYRVVNMSSRAGMLESIKNPEIRKNLTSDDTTIESIGDILSDFITKAKQNSHQDAGYPNSVYGMSKLCLIAATIVQQRIFDDNPEKDIVVNAVCPGYCKTDMTNNKGQLTPKQGADTPVYLATLEPNVKSPRGEFLGERRIIKWKC
ncbi:unnamed protein product [Didymodactylos carnosus]|uniref:carbonyl reductase (NADPH) n=1 Tax=Didymodactylos carnosus TaxID=1234261 RepID=A0A814HR80_9BILA|nr:unnamed protein product [Didymodactylos carnosus]CAF1014282.1 unnamed protein product [Didymodactylos carnosus]CAF3612971.1 unnamed protein product [Didymodactylos carnosus]CAF3785802.1 unnamed protein product [Didymodactylos carnosus]